MKKSFLKAIIIIIIITAIYLIFTNVFIYPCITDGMSMFPTIAPNEIKFTNRWSILTNRSEIKRGDIVIIEEPSILYISEEEFDKNNVLANYEDKLRINPFRKRWMKRIIGLPNDHIQITENNEVYVNGEKLYEEYVKDGYTNTGILGSEYMYIDLIVPENAIYVMGDNRLDSTDSRSFGCVPIEMIYSIL